MIANDTVNYMVIKSLRCSSVPLSMYLGIMYIDTRRMKLVIQKYGVFTVKVIHVELNRDTGCNKIFHVIKKSQQ